MKRQKFAGIKRVIINIGIFLISGAVCFVVLEFLIRALFPGYDPSMMVKFYYNDNGVLLGEKNSTSHHWMKAGDFNVTVRFNQYGLRDVKDLKRSTAHDIFVVGDSFSFGHGVEETKRYSNLLESMLGFPVYNISIPTDFDGYEKLIEYAQQHGAIIKNLIIGVCMENDLKNYQESPNTSLVQGDVEEVSEISPYYNKVKKADFFHLKIFLGEKLALYNVLISIFHRNAFLREIAVKSGIIDKYADGINLMVYSEEILGSSYKRLQKLRINREIPHVTVLIIPSRALWLGDNQEIESKVHHHFVSLLKQQSFDVVDMRSLFEKSGNPFQHHFTHDGHWNELGHRRAAEALFSYLNRKKH